MNNNALNHAGRKDHDHPNVVILLTAATNNAFDVSRYPIRERCLDCNDHTARVALALWLVLEPYMISTQFDP